MDLLFSVSTYILLLISQLASAELSIGTEDTKGGDSPIGPVTHDDLNFRINHAPDQRELLRLLMMASQNNKGTSARFRGQNWGIPYRPVRRIGSEFLGKRSDIPAYYEDDEQVEKRARMGSEFLGKRRMGSEFLGKRRMGSEFLGKRRMGSEFLGKRGRGSEFLGKRRMGSEFLGKRRMGSEFLGKRRMGSEFLGKREDDLELPVESDLQDISPLHFYNSLVYPQQLLDDEKTHHVDDSTGLYRPIMEKRATASEFLGKKQDNGYEYSWKRGRLGSEFLGKRSVEPEQPIPILQTDRGLDTPLATNSNKNSNVD